MKQYIQLGQVPWKESPALVSDPDYRINARRECQAYIQAIRNYLGYEPRGAELACKALSDDGGGTYYEVVCYYDQSMQASADYAARCERQAPATWKDGSVRPPERVGVRGRER